MNPYGIFCMNKMINRLQCTIVWYADDIKAIHIDTEVLTELVKLMQVNYGKHAPLTMTREKVHEYLGMTIDLSQKVKVMISMIDYILKLFSLLPDRTQQDIMKGKTTPASDNLFTVNEENPVKLSGKYRVLVHNSSAVLLLLGNQARTDVQIPIAFLCTRGKVSYEDDYKKLE